ncbi:MAG TPA: phosphatidate cytidylyltransferase [Paracoccaceae bacterium]
MSVSGRDRSQWADLRPRVLSAVAMVAVGALAIWAGGAAIAALVILVCGLMIWELALMTGAGGGAGTRVISVALAVFAGLCLLVVAAVETRLVLILLVLPAGVGALLARREPGIYAAYAVLVMLTGYGLISLRADPGLAVILWLVLVVVASDVLGYFAGRTLGGPKFWPRVSPKKTWSGTVAGWFGAALVGLGFVLAGQGGWGLVWLSPLVALAGQMGDIAESWIKRQVGVKDSSALIPGHGGVMDRFDALAGAVVVVFVLSLLAPLPIGGN